MRSTVVSRLSLHNDTVGRRHNAVYRRPIIVPDERRATPAGLDCKTAKRYRIRVEIEYLPV